MQIAERISRIRRAPKAGNRSNRDALRIGFSCLLAAAAFLSSAAVAQQPRAVITGPKEARPGALVVLDASESTGVGRLWLLAVSPEETSFLPVESGLKCIFASPTPGTYRFVLVVSGTNSNGGAAADMATHSVTLLGAGPPIVPPVVPPPDPTKPPLTTGVTYLVVIRENQDLTADQAAMLAKMRTWTDSQPERLSQLEISPAAGGEDDRLRTYTERAGPLPWLVISRARADGTGAAVLWSGELPGELEQVKARVAEVVK